jgi:hypothetical protein
MSDNANHRLSERFDIESPIKFAHCAACKVKTAKIINCSTEGIYFESDCALMPGTSVFIAGAEDDKYFLATVKWCKKLGGSDKDYYGIGVKYVDAPV